MSEITSVSSVVTQLKELTVDGAVSEAEIIEAFRNELPRVLEFAQKSIEVAERAHELLVNAYSMPDDGQGIRIQSEDAVKLQWALRAVGIGDDAGESSFTV